MAVNSVTRSPTLSRGASPNPPTWASRLLPLGTSTTHWESRLRNMGARPVYDGGVIQTSTVSGPVRAPPNCGLSARCRRSAASPRPAVSAMTRNKSTAALNA